MKFPGLYARLPIPISWISMHDCARKYYDRTRQYYNFRNLKQSSSFEKFKEEIKAVFY